MQLHVSRKNEVNVNETPYDETPIETKQSRED